MPSDAPMSRRVVVMVAGLAVVATGVALTITAEVGVAPYDVLTTGIRDLFDVPIGVAAMLRARSARSGRRGATEVSNSRTSSPV
jgi:uncharacterized membrane protein YczE